MSSASSSSPPPSLKVKMRLFSSSSPPIESSTNNREEGFYDHRSRNDTSRTKRAREVHSFLNENNDDYDVTTNDHRANNNARVQRTRTIADRSLLVQTISSAADDDDHEEQILFPTDFETGAAGGVPIKNNDERHIHQMNEMLQRFKHIQEECKEMSIENNILLNSLLTPIVPASNEALCDQN